MVPLVNHRLLQRVGTTLRSDAVGKTTTGNRASLEELCLFVASVVAFGDEFDVDPTVPPETRELTSELTASLGIEVRATTRPSPDEIAQDTVIGGVLLTEPGDDTEGSRLVGPPDTGRTIDAEQDQLLRSHLTIVGILVTRRADGDDDSTWLTDSWTDRYWGNKLLAALAGVPSTDMGERPLDAYLRELRVRVDAGQRSSAFWYTSALITHMRMGYLGAAAQRTGGIYLASGPVDQTAGRVAAWDDVLRRLLPSQKATPTDDPGSIADLIMNHTLTAAALGPILDDRFRPERPMTLLDTAREHRTPALAKALRQAMAASESGSHDPSWVDGFVDDTQRYVHLDHARRDRLVRMVAGSLTATGGALGIYSPWLLSLAVGAGVVESANAARETYLQRTPQAAVATLLRDTAEPHRLERAETKLSSLGLRH